MDVIDLSEADAGSSVDVSNKKQDKLVVDCWNKVFHKKRKLDELIKVAKSSLVTKVVDPVISVESLIVVKQKRGPKPKAIIKCENIICLKF